MHQDYATGRLSTRVQWISAAAAVAMALLQTASLGSGLIY